MTKGKPAESPAKIKRLIPNAIRTNIVNSTPVCPAKTSHATTSKFAARARLENKSAR